ncbi:MAG: TonB-dependent receptor plug domain-containing protein [Acidobacteriota bacterium]|nr:TonB-dependent receptor plug domain-containing protein [Acidobacteriota bacterium]
MFVRLRAMRRALALLWLLSGFPPPGAGQESEIHEEIVVTAARTPSVFSEAARSVIVIDRAVIETAPVRSVPELLEYALGVDVRQRGPFGVQADLSLRGGTFEQTLVLVDGVKIGDPQTGHHSAILPLTLDDVERVEILKGSGSRLFGPNAFGGAVNIITRKDRETRSRVGAAFGQNGFIGGDVSLAVPLGASGHGLSFSRKRSDGYRENTDFDITTLSYRASLPAAGGEISVFGGHTDKAFGANGFYSDRFPMQWERTRTTFLQSSGEFGRSGLTVVPKVYARWNADEFVLDRNNPAWYRNTHTTHTGGMEIQVSFDSKLGRTAIGGEIGKEGIAVSTLRDMTGLMNRSTRSTTSSINSFWLLIFRRLTESGRVGKSATRRDGDTRDM